MTPMELRQRSGRDGRALRQRELAETLALTAPPEPPPPAAPRERAKLDARAIDLQRRELARLVFGETPASDVRGPTRFMAEMLPQEAAPQPTVQSQPTAPTKPGPMEPWASPQDIEAARGEYGADAEAAAIIRGVAQRGNRDQLGATARSLAVQRGVTEEQANTLAGDVAGMYGTPAGPTPLPPPINPNWRGWENVPREDIIRLLEDARVKGTEDIRGMTPEAQLAAARLLKRHTELGITSGHRSRAYNDMLRRRGVRAARNSRHIAGDAVDLTGVTRENAGQVVRSGAEMGFTGFGAYGPGRHVHMDMGRPRQWGMDRAYPEFRQALAEVRSGNIAREPLTPAVQPETAIAQAEQAAPRPAVSEITVNASASPAAQRQALAAAVTEPQRVAASSTATSDTAEPTVMGHLAMQAPVDRRTAAGEALRRLFADFSGGEPAPAMAAQPMVSRAIQAEEAQMQPIVAEGPGVRPVSFQSPVSSQEGIDRRQQLAEAMLSNSAGMRDIRHPLQGVAQMTQAGVGAFGAVQAERQAQERQAALAAALMGEGGPNLQALAALDPRMAFELAQQQREQALAQQQAEMERQRTLEDRRAEQEWQLQLLRERDAIDDGNRDQFEPLTDEAGNQIGQRNRVTGREERFPQPERFDVRRDERGNVVEQTNTATGRVYFPPQGTTVNVGGEATPSDVRKAMVERAAPLQAAGNTIRSIESTRQLLRDPQIITGFMSGARRELARLGVAAGITDPELVENTDVLFASLAQQTLDELNNLKGPATDRDLVYVQQAAQGNENASAEAIQRILDIRERNLRGAVSAHNQFVDTMLTNNPGLAPYEPMYRVNLPEPPEPEPGAPQQGGMLRVPGMQQGAAEPPARMAPILGNVQPAQVIQRVQERIANGDVTPEEGARMLERLGLAAPGAR